MKLYMCIIFAAFSSVAMAWTDEEKATFIKSNVESCGKELGSKPEDIAAVVNKAKEISEPAKCILACFLKKVKLIGEDNKISVDGAKQMAAQMYPNNAEAAVKGAEEIAHKCIAAQNAGDSACEAAYKYSQCTKTEMQARNITPP